MATSPSAGVLSVILVASCLATCFGQIGTPEVVNRPPAHLEDLRDASRPQLEELFASGAAGGSIRIPSTEQPGELLKGAGLPTLVVCGPACPIPTQVARIVWGGKVFYSDPETKRTTLESILLLVGTAIQAEVYNTNETVTALRGDGKPSVVLDYSISGLPVISKVIDEIRMINPITQLWLGESYLVLGATKILLAYFALEFPTLVEEKFDHIVIGGGASGTGLAFSLAENGHKVCLYERGDLRSKPKNFEGQTIEGFGLGLYNPHMSQVVKTKEKIRTHVANVLSGGTALSAGIQIEERDEYFRFLEREYGVHFDEELINKAFNWVKERTNDPMGQDAMYSDAFRQALTMVGFAPDLGTQRKAEMGSINPFSLFKYDGDKLSPDRERRASDVLLKGDLSANGGALTVRYRQTVLKIEFEETADGVPKAACVVFGDSPDELMPVDSIANERGTEREPRDTERVMNSFKKLCVNPGGEIWLSAGSIYTPVLLMKSGVGPKAVVDKVVAKNGGKAVKYIEELGKNIHDRNFVPLVVFFDKDLPEPGLPATYASYSGLQRVGDNCQADQGEMLDLSAVSKDSCTYINQEEVKGADSLWGLLWSTRLFFPPEFRSLPEVDFLVEVMISCNNDSSLLCAPLSPLIECIKKGAGFFAFVPVVQSRGEVTVNEDGGPIVSGGYYTDHGGHDLYTAVEALKRSLRIVGSGMFDDMMQKRSPLSCPAQVLNGLLDLFLIAARRLPLPSTYALTPQSPQEPFYQFVQSTRDKVLNSSSSSSSTSSSAAEAEWQGEGSPVFQWLREKAQLASELPPLPARVRDLACQHHIPLAGPWCNGDAQPKDKAQMEHAKQFAIFPPLPVDLFDDKALATFAKAHGTSIWHWTGSAPMGTVVDSQFRVKGIDGLNICDASVFPQMSRMNVQADYMMAGRYAAMMRQQEGGDAEHPD
ncbi:unnamed protein product [Vitrella brassicaformis CCMP3155]|uniref:Glucose-methanol-choline oxidoreductase N-terminal domain-containing protein n=4 Tax=Vitrella brassicaformis TaxID=1169539 RepID=A0A0G4ELI1_VITBC|nr:unnamed protein product [Vitrella brassicaformis CCMP3155]|eukprot:CEL98273.1 unnamed protein product [Vitrella brassicaformis CCMP3155]